MISHIKDIQNQIKIEGTLPEGQYMLLVDKLLVVSMLEAEGAQVGTVEQDEKLEVVVLTGIDVGTEVAGLTIVGGETGVQPRGGLFGVGDGTAALSDVQMTVFCAPIIILLEPVTLFALPFTVLLFPSRLLVFPFTALLDPFIALLLPLPLLLLPSMVLLTPVIVLLDTVKVPEFHKESVLLDVGLFESPAIVAGANEEVDEPVMLVYPPQDELLDVWQVLEVEVLSVPACVVVDEAVLDVRMGGGDTTCALVAIILLVEDDGDGQYVAWLDDPYLAKTQAGGATAGCSGACTYEGVLATWTVVVDWGEKNALELVLVMGLVVQVGKGMLFTGVEGETYAQIISEFAHSSRIPMVKISLSIKL